MRCLVLRTVGALILAVLCVATAAASAWPAPATKQAASAIGTSSTLLGGQRCPDRVSSATAIAGSYGGYTQLPLGPSGVRLCGFGGGGLPIKGRPADGVGFGPGPAAALVSIFNSLPPATPAQNACGGSAPTAVVQFDYPSKKVLEAALVGSGCPATEPSTAAPSSAVLFFDHQGRSADGDLEGILVADAGIFAVRRPPVTPDVFGDTVDQAERLVTAHKFTLTFGGEEVGTSFATGIVLLQFPPAGMGDIGNGVEVMLAEPLSPPCTARDLAFSYVGYQGAVGNFAAGFFLRDISAHYCTLVAPLALAGVSQSGRPVTDIVSFTAPVPAVLTPRAASVPIGTVFPVGEVVANLAVMTPDYCPGRTVVPARWRLSVGAQALFVANSAPRNGLPQAGKRFPACGRALASFGLVID